jgi:hypothetical protein
MDTSQNMEQELWKKAHARAGFKIHFILYFIVIAFVWVIWAFLEYLHDGDYKEKWPFYPMLGWGLVILLHYLVVYRWKQKITQKEYEKLLKKEKENKV